MTREEAMAAQKARAFVKGKNDDHGTLYSHGQIIETNSHRVHVRLKGSKTKWYDLKNVVLDRSRNAEYGIKVESSPATEEQGEPHVILDMKQWKGYAGGGNGWTDDDTKWRRFACSSEAASECARLNNNGIKGVSPLRLSVAVQRFTQHLDEITTPSQAAPRTIPNDLLAAVTGCADLKDLHLLGTFIQEVQAVTQADEEDDKVLKSEQQLLLALDRERLDIDRKCDATRNRIEIIEKRRSQRGIEVAALKAKLAALIAR